jgi:uncharacterized protein YndB with AHSA1/START domain
VSSKVLVALRIKAPPLRVFEVFTADIDAWWRPNALFSFTPRSPGVLAFEGTGQGARLVERLSSGKVFEIGAVRVWDPGKRLVFGWRQASFAPGMDTEVEVRFEPAGPDGAHETRVTVEHRGWDTVPVEHVARHRFPDAVFLQRHAEWWRVLLTSLASRAAMDVEQPAEEGDA